jgi:hypothetical protein
MNEKKKEQGKLITFLLGLIFLIGFILPLTGCTGTYYYSTPTRTRTIVAPRRSHRPSYRRSRPSHRRRPTYRRNHGRGIRRGGRRHGGGRRRH